MYPILVPVDFSDITSAVIETATEMARALGAKLHLLHVVIPESYASSTEYGAVLVRTELASHLRREHNEIRALQANLKCQGLEVAALLREGHPITDILDEAKRLDAKLIVLGSHGHGALHKLLLGSVSSGVLRKSTCPVLVVPVRRAVPAELHQHRQEAWANEAEA
jgi:nucleotide-binding universal stress UspA family protein